MKFFPLYSNILPTWCHISTSAALSLGTTVTSAITAGRRATLNCFSGSTSNVNAVTWHILRPGMSSTEMICPTAECAECSCGGIAGRLEINDTQSQHEGLYHCTYSGGTGPVMTNITVEGMYI